MSLGLRLRALTPRSLFVIGAGASLGLFAGGLYFSHAMNLAACPLCILQRMCYLLFAVLAIAGGVGATHHLLCRSCAALAALVAATGLFIAAYQTWIQRFASDVSCSAEQPWWERLVDAAGAQWPWFFEASGLCSDPAWRFLGLSIAEWSLLCFSALLLLMLRAFLLPVTPNRKP